MYSDGCVVGKDRIGSRISGPVDTKKNFTESLIKRIGDVEVQGVNSPGFVDRMDEIVGEWADEGVVIKQLAHNGGVVDGSGTGIRHDVRDSAHRGSSDELLRHRLEMQGSKSGRYKSRIGLE